MPRFAHRQTFLLLVLLYTACSDDTTPPTNTTTDAGTQDGSTEVDLVSEDSSEDTVEDLGIVDEVEPGQHGAACTGHGECDGRTCLTERLLRWFEGGYCTEMDCDLDDPEACGEEAMCLTIMSGFPNVCVRNCNSDAQCRDEQACVGFCLPTTIAADVDFPDALEPNDASIRAVVDGLDEDRMLDRLEILSGDEAWASPDGSETIVSRAVGHPDHDVAVEYLVSLLDGMGYEVNRLTGVSREAPYENLEVRIEGTEPDLPPVYVTAHYDSTISFEEGWQAETDPAPGASDNGSGVVVLLELAEILAERVETDRPQRTVVFVLFDTEELGLLGSDAYVADLVDAGEEVACAFNMDMFAWDSEATAGRFWLSYVEGDEDIVSWALEAMAEAVPEAKPIPSPFELWVMSDHASFQQQGYCATGVSTFPPDPAYHTYGDIASSYDWEFFVTVSRASAAAVAAWVYRYE